MTNAYNAGVTIALARFIKDYPKILMLHGVQFFVEFNWMG